jgi:type II secretory pathway component PulJ
MTLVEVLIALAIGALLLMAVASMTMFSSKSLAGLYNYVDLCSANRLALDKMTREIRQAQRLSGFTTNQLTFVDFDGKKLVYQYFPAERVLKRSKNGIEESLLTECDNLTFTTFQRNTLKGTFDQTPATNDSKIINVNWTCSRTILGTRVNSEPVQSAKIVIRKH